MKSLLKCFCLFLAFLLPLIAHAKPTDRVIFRHPDSNAELWMADIWDTLNARQIFKHTHGIWEFAVEKDGPYVVFIAGHDGEVENDVYLIDRNQSDEKARNLTQKQFEEVWDLDISINGDIIFTNVPTGENPLAKTGLFLIPNSEIKKQVPKIKLLKEIEARELVWAPDGDQIAYSTSDGIFTLNIATRRITRISKSGWSPVFSPDGKKLAFVALQTIHVISIGIPHGQKKTITRLKERVGWGDLKWSPDGEYIFYATFKNNFAAPANGGVHVEAFEQFESGVSFDWINSKGYSVEPKDKLTTLWGELKQ